MRTERINSANNNTNVITAGLAGATATALVSRYMPLSKAEHDNAFKSASKIIQDTVNAAKETEFQQIVDNITNNKKLDNVTDVFVKSKDSILQGAKEGIEQAAQGLDEGAKEVFDVCVKRVADVGKLTEYTENAKVIKQAKKARPIAYFAALAGAASMTLSVLKNMIDQRKVEQQTIGVTYDKEGMIIDAPDSLSLAIILDEIA